MYGDVDRRLAALGRRRTLRAACEQRGAPADLPVPQGDDRANYQAAFDLLKDGKYPEAISGFKQFLTTFPNSALADNAQYWLGEAHYVTKQYPDALRDFRTVLEKYPDSRKIPDALLKIGYCNYELKNWPEARSALEPGRAALRRYDGGPSRQPAAGEDGRGRSDGERSGAPSAVICGARLAASRPAPARRQAHRDLPLHPGRGRQRRLADRLRPTHRLSACVASTATRSTRSMAASGSRLEDVLERVAAFSTRHVCVTGGEPLAQKGCFDLLRQLCDAGYRVSLETSGAMDVSKVDPRVIRVVDVKTPGSGEVARNRLRESRPAAAGRADQVRHLQSRRLRVVARPGASAPARTSAAPCCSARATGRSSRATSRNGSSTSACRCGCRSSCTRFCGATRRAR